MSKRNPNAIRRFPLHVHISALFTLLLLGTGIVMGVFNYHQTSHIILSSSEQLFSRIRQEVQLDLEHTYTPHPPRHQPAGPGPESTPYRR